MLGIVLNLSFVLAEAIAGFSTDSLSLLSDAGHNLGDVASLLLALLAFRLSRMATSGRFTYGYGKTTILVSLLNAVLLLIAVGIIAYEAIGRFSHPSATEGNTIAIVAFIGILVNGGSALLFRSGKDKDLNVKGAYLHLLADALVSLAVVIGGVIQSYTALNWIDPAMSLVIVVVIVWSSWGLLKQSLVLSIDAVPEGVELQKIREIALAVPGIQDIHHIHVWAVSTTRNAMTAHVVVQPETGSEDVIRLKKTLKHELEHYNIAHATIEIESGEECKEQECKV